MLIQILTRTPFWVFALFFGLLALGLVQVRTRQLRWPRLAMLPAAMLALSVFGVWSAHRADGTALATWGGTLLAMVAIGAVLPPPKGAAFDRDTGHFTAPGSGWPLVAIMAIFLTRYAINVAAAIGEVGSGVALVACGIYGLCSGWLLARALRIARTAWTPVAGWGVDRTA